MNDLATSFLVFAGIFGVSLLAMPLRARLPEHHLSVDTKDTVKLAMGLVATMTALVLGLMVASAKSAYDAQKSAVVNAAASIVVLDRMLAHYGPEAAPSREFLRTGLENMIGLAWPAGGSHPAQLDPSKLSGDTMFDLVEELAPQTDKQRELKPRILTNVILVGQFRWLLFEQSGRSISTPLLTVVTCWLAILFFSFGLFAPPNATARGSLLVSALAVAGAILLILELDQPFDGIIRISSSPMTNALAHLGK